MVRAATLTHFADVARQVGLDPQRALRSVGLDPRALNEPEQRLPFAVVNDLLERAAVESGCPTYGLRMGEMRRLSDFGAVSLLISHQPTPRVALSTLTAFRRMLSEALTLNIEESGDLVIVRGDMLSPGDPPVGAQGVGLLVAVLLLMFRAMLGARWRPVAVHFTHAAPEDLTVHRRFFGMESTFNAEFNGLVLAAADLDRPNPAADPLLAHYARLFLDTLPDLRVDDAVQQTRKAVFHLLPLGHASLSDVAQSLGLNERTLQRRLSALDTEFSDVVRDVRRDLALRYLANPEFSVTHVAQLLGYGRIGSFTRWFAGEFGVPPRRWRAAAKPRAIGLSSGSDPA